MIPKILVNNHCPAKIVACYDLLGVEMSLSNPAKNQYGAVIWLIKKIIMTFQYILLKQLAFSFSSGTSISKILIEIKVMLKDNYF